MPVGGLELRPKDGMMGHLVLCLSGWHGDFVVPGPGASSRSPASASSAAGRLPHLAAAADYAVTTCSARRMRSSCQGVTSAREKGIGDGIRERRLRGGEQKERPKAKLPELKGEGRTEP